MEEPGGLCLPHDVRLCQMGELGGREVRYFTFFEDIAPVAEVRGRVQRGVLSCHGVPELVVLGVEGIDELLLYLPWILPFEEIDGLPCGPDVHVNVTLTIKILLLAFAWRLLHVLDLPQTIEASGTPAFTYHAGLVILVLAGVTNA